MAPSYLVVLTKVPGKNKCFLLNVYKRVEMEIRALALFCEVMVGSGGCGLAETPPSIRPPALNEAHALLF